MGAGEALAGRDPSVRAEVLHESERTRVTRLFLPRGTVIRKELLGPGAERRLRHEATMLGRLRGVAGLSQLAGAPRYAGSIVLEDTGGASRKRAAVKAVLNKVTVHPNDACSGGPNWRRELMLSYIAGRTEFDWRF